MKSVTRQKMAGMIRMNFGTQNINGTIDANANADPGADAL